jgi:hypothetical protein
VGFIFGSIAFPRFRLREFGDTPLTLSIPSDQ